MFTGLPESWKTFLTDVMRMSHDSGAWGQFQNSSEIRDFRSGCMITRAPQGPMVLFEVLNTFLGW